MNRLIILAAIITMALCCRAQSCNSTYMYNATAIENQYKNLNKCCCKCDTSMVLFRNTANSIIGKLAKIIDNTPVTAFKFDPRESEHFQSSNFSNIMTNFTPICQRYTDVMANKYYLQDILFNKTVDTTVTKQLISVIIKLQVMANSLQTAQMESDRNSCVKFTPSQYTNIIYYSRLNNPLIRRDSLKLDAICVLQMRTQNWQNKKID